MLQNPRRAPTLNPLQLDNPTAIGHNQALAERSAAIAAEREQLAQSNRQLQDPSSAVAVGSGQPLRLLSIRVHARTCRVEYLCTCHVIFVYRCLMHILYRRVRTAYAHPYIHSRQLQCSLMS